MKLGIDFPDSWKEKSKKEGIPLTDLLYGYVVEDLMLRISTSSFREHLWLTNERVLGEDAYRKTSKESLELLYVENKKTFAKTSVEPGDGFSEKVIKLLTDELFEKSANGQEEKKWTYKYEEKDVGIVLLLNCTYREMQVPATVHINPITFSGQQPQKKTLSLLFEQRKTCEYYAYSKEYVLSEALYEILYKMELISSMEFYDTVNEILMTQSISGRHILENLKTMTANSPKMISQKRMGQISSYKEYGYMKKRWQQYLKQQKKENQSWEDVMERLCAFLTPLWKALCENEIFFDDWMPELGRFLS